MDPLRSILVGVDFSPGSAAALRQAVRIAAAMEGATVRAVHVINTHVLTTMRALSPMQKNIQAQLETEARREWLQFEPDLPGKDAIPFDIMIGNATACMLDAVRDHAADLLVLGIHREKGSESGAGTVAGACVRKAPARVLLVRPEQTEAFKRIVACVDFSGASARVVAEAARLARIDAAVIDIVHVFEPPWRQLHYFAPTPTSTPEFQAGYRAEMMSKLRAFCQGLAPDLEGLVCEYKLDEHHSAGRGIIEFAVDNQADLIVMAAHNTSGLKELILGSTAERVLKSTPCSMMTVRVSGD